jgi:hypothetical protein
MLTCVHAMQNINLIKNVHLYFKEYFSMFLKDAIVQTDQRLVFLLHRSSAERLKQRHKLKDPTDMEDYDSNR